MSTIPRFLNRPLPKNVDPETVAVLEDLLQQIELVLSEIKDVADDHETRITALEP